MLINKSRIRDDIQLAEEKILRPMVKVKLSLDETKIKRKV